jgi:hypothetical protein
VLIDRPAEKGGNQPINSSDIDLETPVTIDAREAANVSLVAIKVCVDSPPTTTDL